MTNLGKEESKVSKQELSSRGPHTELLGVSHEKISVKRLCRRYRQVITAVSERPESQRLPLVTEQSFWKSSADTQALRGTLSAA